MLIFACLICKTSFEETNVKVLEKNRKKSQDNYAVLTQCGHYFHLNCLEGAFIYDKIRMDTLNLPSRKSCPLPGCGKDLSQTSLARINPMKVKALDPESKMLADFDQLKSDLDKYKRDVFELTVQIKDLKKRITDSKATFVPGDRVAYKRSNSNNNFDEEPCYGTVLKVRVDIEPDLNNNNNNNNRISNNGTWKESASKLLHQISLTNQQNVSVSSDQVNLVDPKQMTRQYSVDEYSDLEGGPRLKWAAGDRIYLPLEKESATIKWIGSKEYRFEVIIEYDHPVGDETIVSDDLPFLIKEGHGRRLTIEELYNCAEKESKSPTAFLNGIVRWGSRNRGKPAPRRTSTFYTIKDNANDDL